MGELTVFVADENSTEEASFSYEGILADEEDGNVLWVPTPHWVSGPDLDEYLADTVSQDIRRYVDITLFALNTSLTAEVDADPFVEHQIAQRLEMGPFQLLREPPSDYVLTGVAELPQVPASALRDADVKTVLMRTGVDLPENAHLHYEGPNGEHYRRFRRPGIGLRSRDELDRLSYWLAPFFADPDIVIVDTWSMQSLALYAAQRAGRHIEILSLREYGEASTAALVHKLTNLFGDLSSPSVMCLSSAVTTGRLIESVEEAAHICDLPTADSVALFGPEGDLPCEVLATVRSPSTGSGDDCAVCAEAENRSRSLVAPIQPDTYLLAMDAISTREAITRGDAAPGREFIDRYVDPDTGLAACLQLHRTHERPNDRHHAFFIDVAELLKHPTYISRLDETIEQVCVAADSGIDALLAPADQASTALARYVSERLELPLIDFDEAKVLSDSAELPDEVLEAQNILFVDDVSITGTRLLGVRNAIIRGRRRANVDPVFELFSLIGVHRPTRADRGRGTRDITHHFAEAHRFFAVEELVLPNWSSDRCPWCIESRVIRQTLQQLAAGGHQHDSLSARLDALDDIEAGLVDKPLFAPSTSAPEPSDDDLSSISNHLWDEVNPQSVFGDTPQGSAVVFAVASALQRMRDPKGSERGPRLDDIYRSPVSKRLDPALYLTGRFYESALVAAVLRCAAPHDIRGTTHCPDLEQALTDHATRYPTGSELRWELALAVARQQLPASCFPDQEAPTGDQDPIDGLALSLIRSAAHGRDLRIV